MALSVLYVCTGNVCRSPVAELLLRALCPPPSGVSVASAGTAALVGQGIDTGSAAVLRQLGIDPGRHRARQFEPAMANAADLVLTAEREHRDHVMAQAPGAFRRTFTMKEFARLAGRVPVAPALDVIAYAASIRNADGQVSEELDNMPDPFGGRVPQARAIARDVARTVRTTIAALGLDPDPLAAAGPAAPLARPRPRPRPA